jgi:hypothetical protein
VSLRADLDVVVYIYIYIYIKKTLLLTGIEPSSSGPLPITVLIELSRLTRSQICGALLRPNQDIPDGGLFLKATVNFITFPNGEFLLLLKDDPAPWNCYYSFHLNKILYV